MKRTAPLPALALVFLGGCAVMSPPTEAPPVKAEAPAAKAAPTPAAPATTASSAAAKPAIPAATKSAAPISAKPAAPAASKPTAPAPLDLTTLEQQLRETKAIGVMTKLSLKNQVDDLLAQFRAYYEGRLKTSLADLRRPYELLLMKVLAVLQDGDPALARAINASREAIWSILADRDKFAKVAS